MQTLPGPWQFMGYSSHRGGDGVRLPWQWTLAVFSDTTDLLSPELPSAGDPVGWIETAKRIAQNNTKTFLVMRVSSANVQEERQVLATKFGPLIPTDYTAYTNHFDLECNYNVLSPFFNYGELDYLELEEWLQPFHKLTGKTRETFKEQIAAFEPLRDSLKSINCMGILCRAIPSNMHSSMSWFMPNVIPQWMRGYSVNFLNSLSTINQEQQQQRESSSLIKPDPHQPAPPQRVIKVEVTNDGMEENSDEYIDPIIAGYSLQSVTLVLYFILQLEFVAYTLGLVYGATLTDAQLRSQFFEGEGRFLQRNILQLFVQIINKPALKGKVAAPIQTPDINLVDSVETRVLPLLVACTQEWLESVQHGRGPLYATSVERQFALHGAHTYAAHYLAAQWAIEAQFGTDEIAHLIELSSSTWGRITQQAFGIFVHSVNTPICEAASDNEHAWDVVKQLHLPAPVRFRWSSDSNRVVDTGVHCWRNCLIQFILGHPFARYQLYESNRHTTQIGSGTFARGVPAVVWMAKMWPTDQTFYCPVSLGIGVQPRVMRHCLTTQPTLVYASHNLSAMLARLNALLERTNVGWSINGGGGGGAEEPSIHSLPLDMSKDAARESRIVLYPELQQQLKGAQLASLKLIEMQFNSFAHGSHLNWRKVCSVAWLHLLKTKLIPTLASAKMRLVPARSLALYNEHIHHSTSSSSHSAPSIGIGLSAHAIKALEGHIGVGNAARHCVILIIDNEVQRECAREFVSQKSINTTALDVVVARSLGDAQNILLGKGGGARQRWRTYSVVVELNAKQRMGTLKNTITYLEAFMRFINTYKNKIKLFYIVLDPSEQDLVHPILTEAINAILATGRNASICPAVGRFTEGLATGGGGGGGDTLVEWYESWKWSTAIARNEQLFYYAKALTGLGVQTRPAAHYWASIDKRPAAETASVQGDVYYSQFNARISLAYVYLSLHHLPVQWVTASFQQYQHTFTTDSAAAAAAGGGGTPSSSKKRSMHYNAQGLHIMLSKADLVAGGILLSRLNKFVRELALAVQRDRRQRQTTTTTLGEYESMVAQQLTRTKVNLWVHKQSFTAAPLALLRLLTAHPQQQQRHHSNGVDISTPWKESPLGNVTVVFWDARSDGMDKTMTLEWMRSELCASCMHILA